MKYSGDILEEEVNALSTSSNQIQMENQSDPKKIYARWYQKLQKQYRKLLVFSK